MRYNNDPRFITARFDSVCPQTKRPIRKGETCAYYPSTREAFHVESDQAEELRVMQWNEAHNMADANW